MIFFWYLGTFLKFSNTNLSLRVGSRLVVQQIPLNHANGSITCCLCASLFLPHFVHDFFLIILQMLCTLSLIYGKIIHSIVLGYRHVVSQYLFFSHILISFNTKYMNPKILGHSVDLRHHEVSVIQFCGAHTLGVGPYRNV